LSVAVVSLVCHVLIRTTCDNDDFAAEVRQLSIRIERFRHGGKLRIGSKSLLVR
jgi:hypothetical protein